MKRKLLLLSIPVIALLTGCDLVQTSKSFAKRAYGKAKHIAVDMVIDPLLDKIPGGYYVVEHETNEETAKRLFTEGVSNEKAVYEVEKTEDSSVSYYLEAFADGAYQESTYDNQENLHKRNSEGMLKSVIYKDNDYYVFNSAKWSKEENNTSVKNFKSLLQVSNHVFSFNISSFLDETSFAADEEKYVGTMEDLENPNSEQFASYSLTTTITMSLNVEKNALSSFVLEQSYSFKLVGFEETEEHKVSYSVKKLSLSNISIEIPVLEE